MFEGIDGSQAVLWICRETTASEQHVHDFDEYLAVIEGEYTVVMNDKSVTLYPGDELFIPKGTPHSDQVKAGSRVMNVFGGKRVSRIKEPRSQ